MGSLGSLLSAPCSTHRLLDLGGFARMGSLGSLGSLLSAPCFTGTFLDFGGFARLGSLGSLLSAPCSTRRLLDLGGFARVGSRLGADCLVGRRKALPDATPCGVHGCRLTSAPSPHHVRDDAVEPEGFDNNIAGV